MSNTDATLKGYLDEIMGANAEIDEKREEIKEVYSSVKASGYDVKALRKVVARKRKEREDVLAEDEAMYRMENSIGMKLPDW